MQAVVLAAGRGTRLHPLTTQRSKAMIPVLGKPMVARVLETLIQNGVDRLIIVVSDTDAEIRDYFKGTSASPLAPAFVVQPARLGMGNALQCAAHLIDGPFILSACDNITSSEHVAELIATHKRRTSLTTLSLMEVARERVSSTGIVALEGEQVVRIVEKPSPIDAPSNIASLPLYVFSSEILAYLPAIKPSPRGEYELQDAIQMAIDDGADVSGVYTPTRRQLTSADDLLALNLHYLDNGTESVQIDPARVGRHTHLVTPLYIEERTVIGDGCVIGPRVYIEHGCIIGSYVSIRDAVILRNSRIGDGCTISNQVLAGAATNASTNVSS